MHEHHHASGIDKAGIKSKIRMLKQERDRTGESCSSSRRAES